MPTYSLDSHLSLADVQRFASAKFPDGSSCPRCGTNRWQYADETETREIVGPAIFNQNGTSSGVFATIIFTCDNCGFVASHAKSVVVNWLNQHEQ